MPSSRYGQLNPQLTASPIAEEPLQFSNAIADPSYDVLPSPYVGDESLNNASKKQRFRVKSRSVSNNTADGLTYTGSDGNINSRPPKRRRTSSSLYKAASSIREFAVSHFTIPRVAAPWKHEISEKQHGASLPPSSSVRYFDYRRQRHRLLTNSSFQWLVTAFICATLTSCLYGYSTLTTGISTSRKYIFNALVTGLSLCLGFNLASSFSGYAQMMRWRFLASGYRTLQDFELVMNCDSQSKVFRLIWAGRTRGSWFPNKTQMLAVVWLSINIALQVFTALLGLTYSIDVSSEYVRLTYGNVSIVDVSYIGNAETTARYAGNYSSPASLLAETAVANELGVTGQDYSVWNTSIDNYFTNEQSIYTDGSFFWYRFIDRSPLALQLAAATRRTVNATATCESFPVTYGGYAGFQTDNESLIWDVTWIDATGQENTWWIPDQATGATTWMTNLTSDCGPRCMQIYALQTADNITDVPTPRFWSCLSTVSHVDNIDLYTDPNQYQIPDIQAQILAGAIGSSGLLSEGNNHSTFTTPEDDLQMVQYPYESQWSPPGNVSAEEMAVLVMKFTTGTISALDSNGPRLNVTGYGPAPAQILNVQWNYAASILGGIPLAQGLVLLVVILFADKAIIKDTSPLSTARLLRPIVEKLGDTGCLLTGDEIAEQLGNYKVIYGVREPDVGLGGGMGVDVIGGEDGMIRHLDILEESEGLWYRRGRMPEGKYDGLYPLKEEEMGELSEREKDFDNDRESKNDEKESRGDGMRRRKGRARRMSI